MILRNESRIWTAMESRHSSAFLKAFLPNRVYSSDAFISRLENGVLQPIYSTYVDTLSEETHRDNSLPICLVSHTNTTISMENVLPKIEKATMVVAREERLPARLRDDGPHLQETEERVRNDVGREFEGRTEVCARGVRTMGISTHGGTRCRCRAGRAAKWGHRS
jgi:hypothetical protein